MAVFNVNSERIQTESANVSATVEAIRGDVNTMMINLRNLQDAWGGQAAELFQDLADQWHSAQEQVEAALDAISTQLATASNTYSEAEASAASLFALG